MIKIPPAKSASPFAKGDKGGFKTEQEGMYFKIRCAVTLFYCFFVSYFSLSILRNLLYYSRG
jgi:hypothetical protein